MGDLLSLKPSLLPNFIVVSDHSIIYFDPSIQIKNLAVIYVPSLQLFILIRHCNG